MKFSLRILTICLLSTLVIVSCKKEDDNINEDTNPNEGGDNIETIFGCMVDTACNYNSVANVDNESCDYSCYGCTDELAFNYDQEATIDDGSCTYASQIMANSWSVESNCDGFIMSPLIDAGASEITIVEGSDEGDLVVDFGLFTLEGTIDNDGNISVSGEDPTGLTQLSGAGFLQSENTAIINITATVTLLSENCTLTLNLIE
tara:strand:+ start:161 stop:772 length:612 start_codon:yes stop_codon:yes gene_type:complete